MDLRPGCPIRCRVVEGEGSDGSLLQQRCNMRMQFVQKDLRGRIPRDLLIPSAATISDD